MNTESSIKGSGDIEGEFNHQHIIADGCAGMLFQATMGLDSGSINNSVLNSNAYAIQSSLHEMNKNFEALLTLYNSDNKKTIEEMRNDESDRQEGIIELAEEFEDHGKNIRRDSIIAIQAGTTVEEFQEEVLRAISLKNYNDKRAI